MTEIEVRKIGAYMGVVVFEAHLCANGNHGNQTGSGVVEGSDWRKYAAGLADAGAIAIF